MKLDDLLLIVKYSSIDPFLHLAYYIPIEVFDGNIEINCPYAVNVLVILKFNHIFTFVVKTLIKIFQTYFERFAILIE